MTTYSMRSSTLRVCGLTLFDLSLIGKHPR